MVTSTTTEATVIGQKDWWRSRTIWSGIVGIIFTALSLSGALPEGLSSSMVVETILGIVSVCAIVFRAKAETTITPIIIITSPSPTDTTPK